MSLEDGRKLEETGCGFEPVARSAREDEEELAEYLAVARQALDEYEKSGVEGTMSYDEYRRNRQIRDAST